VTGSITPPVVVKQIIIGISLCILIFAIIFAFPLLGVFALLFLPLPILYYRLKLGRNSSLVIVGISFIVLLIMTKGLAFDILYFGSLLGTGLFLGECIERHFGIEKTMILSGLGVMGSAFLAFLLYSGFQDQTMTAMVSDYLTRYFGLTAQLYSDMGIEQDQIEMLNSAFLIVMPGMFAVSLRATMWMNILIMKKLLLRKGIQLKKNGKPESIHGTRLSCLGCNCPGGNLIFAHGITQIYQHQLSDRFNACLFFSRNCCCIIFFPKKKIPSCFADVLLQPDCSSVILFNSGHRPGFF